MNKGLALKIYNVMCATEGLKKDLVVGKDTKGAYRAVGEKAVLNMIKPLLIKEKLIIRPIDGTIEDYVNKTIAYAKEGTRAITQIKLFFEITDVETGESTQIVGFGNGADSQDKGSGKAFTYAYKTALSKTFMLFSGEDADNHHSEDIGKDKEPAPTKSKPTKIDCTDLINEGFKKGFDARAIERALIKNYKHGMEFITQTEHDKTLETLISLPEKDVVK